METCELHVINGYVDDWALILCRMPCQLPVNPRLARFPEPLIDKHAVSDNRVMWVLSGLEMNRGRIVYHREINVPEVVRLDFDKIRDDQVYSSGSLDGQVFRS